MSRQRLEDMGPRQDQGPDPSGQDEMAKEVSVQITSDAAFAKTRMSGRERMQARRARHQEWKNKVVEATTEDPEELAKSSSWRRRTGKFTGR